MGKIKTARGYASLWTGCFALWLMIGMLLFPHFASTAYSLCAVVKIEIQQEATLERQAFDAHMRINNGLSHITLENVSVNVTFADDKGNSVLASSDSNNTDAHFFIRQDNLQNISDINGSGTIAPSSSADIHWLIIPAPGAAGGLKKGSLYYVGATLSYHIGGEPHITEVAPDYIFVKPMPELTMDYFLPSDVYGDDAYTPEIEPAIPFSLGVRVQNNGNGIAKNLKIDSAQPKIVDNEQNMLIDFTIEGSEVDGQPTNNSLLVDFGDVSPQTSKAARWIMTCSLSGRFVDFEADFSHSDALGGELTSLIKGIRTHSLTGDVLVDLPGRDLVKDFLAKDGDVYRVYESDSTPDTVVADQSTFSELRPAGQNGSEIRYTLTTPPTDGFMFVKLSDPLDGTKALRQVIRSDGKFIRKENTWLSKNRTDNHTWRHFINLFDVNSRDTYTLIFDNPSAGPQPPVLQSIPDCTGMPGERLYFTVKASDPDGTIPKLRAENLPAGAVFTDQTNGTGIFDWSPTESQAGTYPIIFKASDGVLESSRQAVITITSVIDADHDGMGDDWEMRYFGTLDRDGKGDFDGDGVSDLNEYLKGTEPVASNAPSIPAIVSPRDTSEITNPQPELVVSNSVDPDSDQVTYIFELYADEGMTDLVMDRSDIAEGVKNTSWTVFEALNDNTRYYWRVRATDGIGYSAWAYGSFFVNTTNDPPGDFNISSPQDDSEVDTLTPLLEVTNSLDVDDDLLVYAFELFGEQGLYTLINASPFINQGFSGTTAWRIDSALNDNTWYFWRVTATDEHGTATESATGSFFVNTANDAPQTPLIAEPADPSEVAATELDLVTSNAFDADEDELGYFFELDTQNTFDSPALQSSGEIAEETDFTAWHVFGLKDNTFYFWRVKADDGLAQSPWSGGVFFVNTSNDPPSTVVLKNPGQNAWVSTLTPSLELNAAQDVDRDTLIYRFELYADRPMQQLLVGEESITPDWMVPFELEDNTWYYWRAQAEDEHGSTGSWMTTAAFFTDSNGINDPPAILMREPQENIVTDADNILISWEDSDPETDAEIDLYFDTDSAGEDGTLIVAGLTENPDAEGDTWFWDLTSVAEGTYYIYATITDGNTTVVNYAPGYVTIARPPTIEITSPQAVQAFQDTALLAAAATDDSGIADVFFYLREPSENAGIAIDYEDLEGVFETSSGQWEYDLSTTALTDGNYIVFARAVDIYGNEGWSPAVTLSIRNWIVIEHLPGSQSYHAGRTIPVKFSLQMVPEADPTMPFVRNENLEIRIYDQADPGVVLQQSFYGNGARSYRINREDELYITNFKTSRTPAVYTVEIRNRSNDFLVGTFNFETF